ncbi:hypothetical protein CASFOL_030448 [Castilleja foliolosa]|uniref:J domain-containing protein n=1 Tax=Castilleja foliolosa TaxID=1961234 RepID=A0ABD3C8K9_9LAMI
MPDPKIKLLKFVNKYDPADERHILHLYDYFYHQEHLFIVTELLRANLHAFKKYNRESDAEPYLTLQRLQYWKLSLIVHPHKSSHPQAQQAFVKLDKAFKNLQDPDKRKALDDRIKLKEEQDAFKANLKAMCEAAQWTRLQEMDAKAAPKREE